MAVESLIQAPEVTTTPSTGEITLADVQRASRLERLSRNVVESFAPILRFYEGMHLAESTPETRGRLTKARHFLESLEQDCANVTTAAHDVSRAFFGAEMPSLVGGGRRSAAQREKDVEQAIGWLKEAKKNGKALHLSLEDHERSQQVMITMKEAAQRLGITLRFRTEGKRIVQGHQGVVTTEPRALIVTLR